MQKERKLIIYIVVDGRIGSHSEISMNYLNGLTSFKKSMSQDPYALETLNICVIQAGLDAWPLQNITEINQWSPSLIFSESSMHFSLGLAFKIIKNSLFQNFNFKSSTHPGDFLPIILIFSTSIPTDSWMQSIADLSSNFPIGGISLFYSDDDENYKNQDYTRLNPSSIIDLQQNQISKTFSWIDQ